MNTELTGRGGGEGGDRNAGWGRGGAGGGMQGGGGGYL